MDLSLICEKCGKIHTSETDGAHLVIDFKRKQISFICQNKACKKDNIFGFDNWVDKVTTSPLPRIRTM